MTASFTYSPVEKAVFWGTIRLDDEGCETLLDLFERAGAPAAFNELYDAHMKAGGVPRCSSLRAA